MVNAFLMLAAEKAEKSETIFYVLGCCFAAWAILVGTLGMRSETFPKDRGATTAVIAVSVLLAAATMASIIYVSN